MQVLTGLIYLLASAIFLIFTALVPYFGTEVLGLWRCTSDYGGNGVVSINRRSFSSHSWHVKHVDVLLLSRADPCDFSPQFETQLEQSSRSRRINLCFFGPGVVISALQSRDYRCSFGSGDGWRQTPDPFLHYPRFDNRSILLIAVGLTRLNEPAISLNELLCWSWRSATVPHNARSNPWHLPLPYPTAQHLQSAVWLNKLTKDE